VPKPQSGSAGRPSRRQQPVALSALIDALNSKIPVSDRARLRGLTQFLLSSRYACRQSTGTAGHVESDMRKGRFCAILFKTVRKSLILNGEMSEWSIEHAWKACVGETLPRVRIPLSPPISSFVPFHPGARIQAGHARPQPFAARPPTPQTCGSRTRPRCGLTQESSYPPSSLLTTVSVNFRPIISGHSSRF
jgi:hypothetical protein